MNLVLGFVGNACAGKDTTSGLITDQFFSSIRSSGNRQSIKDEITGVHGSFDIIKNPENQEKIVVWHTPLALEVKREYAQETPGVDFEKLLYDPVYKSQHREGLIRVGDGRREDVDPLYWIKKVQITIKHIINQFLEYNYHVFNITDMRYENELPHFEAHCYEINIPILSFKILADLSTIIQRMPPNDVASYIRRHKNNPSERNVKRVHADMEIDNNGDHEQLKNQICLKVIPVIHKILFT